MQTIEQASNPKYHFMASLDHDGNLHIVAGACRHDVQEEYNLARTLGGPKKLFMSYMEYPLMTAISAIKKQSGAREYTLRYIGTEGDLPLDANRKGSVMNKLLRGAK